MRCQDDTSRCRPPKSTRKVDKEFYASVEASSRVLKLEGLSEADVELGVSWLQSIVAALQAKAMTDRDGGGAGD
jgi:hypothetical protein